MPSRRTARKVAVQLLYQNDVANCSVDDTLASLRELPVNKLDAGGEEYVGEIVRLTIGNKDEIDTILRGLSEHWRLERIGMTERNILRLAVCEILHRPDIPPRVSVNEAIELAKQFGDQKSSAFVNGILDAALKRFEAESEEEK